MLIDSRLAIIMLKYWLYFVMFGNVSTCLIKIVFLQTVANIDNDYLKYVSELSNFCSAIKWLTKDVLEGIVDNYLSKCRAIS